MSIREKRGPLALEAWAKHLIDGYKNCNIKNMTTSWRNGLAFCALIHRFRPDLINYDELDPNDIIGNCSLAFEVAERQFGIPALLDPVDMLALEVPDRLSVLTYVAQFYNTFKSMNIKATAALSPSSSPKLKKHQHPSHDHVEHHNTNRDKKSPTPKRTLDIEDEALHEARKKLSNNSSPVMLRSTATCSVCSNPVYISERILFNKKLYHRSCFRCFNCNHILNPQTADISNDGLLFCIENTCFIEQQKRSRESKLNINTSSNASVNSSTEVLNHQHKQLNGGYKDKENIQAELNDSPNVSLIIKSFESSSGGSSSNVSEQNSSIDLISNKSISRIDEQDSLEEKTHITKIRFDETVVVKSSVEEVNSNNEIIPKFKELKSADEVQDPDDKLEERNESNDQPSREPSDILVLKPNSSLTAEIKQREDDEILRRNTAANEIVAKVEVDNCTSGIDVKTVHEMPNIYNASNLPIAQRLERDVQNLEENKKNQFLNGMLESDKEKDKSSGETNLEDHEVKTSDHENHMVKVESHVKVVNHVVGTEETEVKTLEPDVKELKPVTKIEEPELIVSSTPSTTIENNEEPKITPVPLKVKSETLSPLPVSGQSPTPSPAPRRKSPAPSTASTTSTVSLSESVSTPNPTPRRSKMKPPRPAPPSKASLTSLSNRGSVPSAKELWKKENYYPAELNPFESEEDLPNNSSSTVNTIPKVPSNPFEEDDDEQEVETPASPKPSPRIRSARNQVNSITQGRSRSHSRSRSRSPVNKPQRAQPQPSPRLSRALTNTDVVKSERKPYNPFEDDDDDGNEIGIGDVNESGIFNDRMRRSDEDIETSSASSSLICPTPKMRQSLSSTTSSAEGGTMKLKSNKAKRAPLPPAQSFQTTPNKGSGPSTYNSGTPPRSPKSILKTPQQSQSLSSCESPGKQKKIVPASPDLLKGLKTSGKKKRRAPPPRRRVEPLPEEAIKTEMNDLVIKERELERQGITLESNIRRLMEQESKEEANNGEESTNGNEQLEQQVDEMTVQLWNIVNEKNDILRRQTELEYLRRGHRLEELQAELEFKLRVLMDTPLNERQDDYAQVEQSLIDELLKIVDERNEVVEWLDFHRKQDREEDTVVSNTLTTYSANSTLQRQQKLQESSNVPVALITSMTTDSDKSKSSKTKAKDKQKQKDKAKDKHIKDNKEVIQDISNGNIEGEKVEKQKKSKIKSLLFGKKKHKSSFKNKDGQDDSQQQIAATNGENVNQITPNSTDIKS